MSVGYGSLAIDADGRLYGWGRDSYGHLMTGGTKYVPTYTGQTGVRQVAQGEDFTAILYDNGEVWTVGVNTYGQLGHSSGWGSSNAYGLARIMTGVRLISTGQYHVIALKENGELWGWGDSYAGALAGAYTSSHIPVLPRLMDTGVKFAAAGRYQSYWVKENGDLYAVGYAGNHALGYGSNNSTSTPHMILTEVARVYANGVDSGYAIKENGELWAWGLNNYGQLGLGDNSLRERPTYVKSNIAQVTGGYYFALFLDTNGNLYGAGYNYYGQLGTANGFQTGGAVYYTLIKTGVRSMGCGFYHSVIVMQDSTMFCVGYNYEGQLGRNINNGDYYTHVVTTSNMGAPMNFVPSTSITLTNLSAASPIHKQDSIIRLTATHSKEMPVKYRILVNGTQVIPESGWTAPSPSPFQLVRALEYTRFNLGDNTVTVMLSDDSGSIVSRVFTVRLANAAPSVDLTMTGIIHKQHLSLAANLSDSDGDTVQYRVFLNNSQVFPSGGEWSSLQVTPYTMNTVILNTDLPMGANTVKVEARDDMGVATTVTRTVTKVNAAPSAVGGVTGTMLRATLIDSDNDQVRYAVLLNGTQVFPGTGLTQYYNTPLSIEYRLPTSLINIGRQNTATVTVQDDMGATFSRDFTFIGDYSGLMFTDEQGTYYSSDIGDVLRYLDFGTLIAGGTTQTVRVWVKNTLGFSVDNLRLWVLQRELDGIEAKVEISKTDAPFESGDVISYSERINHGERVSFYVRVTATRLAKTGGMFDIVTKADPV